MKIESVSPSTEMLRACFEKGFDFTVHYKAGLDIRVVNIVKGGWGMYRDKNGKALSGFRFLTDKDTVGLWASDTLLYALVEGMYTELRSRRVGLTQRDYVTFMESVLRVYGGKVANIKFVSVENGNV